MFIRGPLSFNADVLPTFLSGVLAFDIQYPRFLLWTKVCTAPEEVADYLVRLDPKVAIDQTPDQLLHGFRALSPDEQRDAERMTRKLARLWQTLAKQPEELHGCFLPLSLNANAMEMTRTHWEEHHETAQVADWHIDLRAYIDNPNQVTRAELVAARKHATEELRKKDIASQPGRVEVFLKANLPFAAWLGWNLRKLQDIQVLNQRGGQFTVFTGPGKELRLERTGTLELLEQTGVDRDGPGDHAVLIIDVLDKSNREQLDAFRDEVGEPVAYRAGILLQQRASGDITPEHAEPFLRDCVETLGQLAKQGIKQVHLGLSMPDTLAFLLGRQLHARVARISLYEYRRTRDCYEYIFDLEQE